MLNKIMKPKSIAVIGASTKEHTIGSDIMKRLQEYKFNGKIYPVNPKGGIIEGLQAYTSVVEIPDEIDLAIIVVNAKFVLSTNYYDEYNYTLSMKNINGGKSSRDGSTIVYDEIKTEWGDNGLELGKNESYRRYQYSLSDDGRNLTIAKFKPVSDLSISNNAGQPNWSVFNNQLNDADQWTYDGIMTLSIQDGQVKIYGTTDMGEGTLSPGDVENSVLFTNPYQGQWRLSDWKVQTGDDNYHKE